MSLHPLSFFISDMIVTMRSVGLLILFTVATISAPSPISEIDRQVNIVRRDDAEDADSQKAPDIGALTSYFAYDSCEPDEIRAIAKAQDDANYIAVRYVILYSLHLIFVGMQTWNILYGFICGSLFRDPVS